MMIISQSNLTYVNYDYVKSLHIFRAVHNGSGDIYYINAQVAPPSRGDEILAFYKTAEEAQWALLEIQAAIERKDKFFHMPMSETPLTGHEAKYLQGERI